MKKEYRVRYTVWPPWAMDIPVGNETKFVGALRDAFDALSYSLKYNFDTQSQADHQFGALQADGNFSGMLGALQRKEVDIAGPFVGSYQRAMVTDFTNCLEFSKLGIITGIMSADRNMFLYVKVFSWQLWLALLMTVIGLAFAAALIYNVTVDGWKDDQISLLGRYFWVFWSYLIGHDCGSTNHWALVNIWKLQSFRILLAAWLLGPVINSLFSFQGSITSTFAITKLRPVIADLEELTAKTYIIPVLSRGSAVQICFMTSRDTEHLWKRMENNMIIFSANEVQRTLQKIEKGTHVLIIDYNYALTVATEYVRSTGRCTVQVEELLFCQNFISLGVRKGMPRTFLREINTRLTHIFQAKLTDRWVRRVFPNYTHCTKQPQEDSKPLSITDILGGFVIWGIGIVCSILLVLVEVFENRREKTKERKKTFSINSFDSSSSGLRQKCREI